MHVIAHPYELATLVSAARWAAGGDEEPLAAETRERLEAVLAQYDEQVRRVNERVNESDGETSRV